nr:phosphoenolpyruvate--protein phosphotransferase [uncultured Schaedlerella sp.]
MKLKGVSTSPQIVIGEVMQYVPFTCEVEPRQLEDHKAAEEVGLYQRAKEAAFLELSVLGEILEKKESSNTDFVAAHQEILNDPVMDQEIRQMIEGGPYYADFAVTSVFDRYRELFAANKNALIQERASDLQDVKMRLLRCYYGEPEKNLSKISKPCIIAAEELFPSDTLCLDEENIKGIITEKGSLTSHTAIIARTLDIPALLGAEGIMGAVQDGDRVILDGTAQEAVVGADAKAVDRYLEKAGNIEKDMEITRLYYKKEPLTADDVKIDLRVNIASPEFDRTDKVPYLDGVGLFRSEFLYLSRKNLPSEEEQFLAYRKIAGIFKEKPVVLRTLDIGGDKQVPYMELPKEDNPFLGIRGLRLCLNREDIFRTQLRAALRASAYGNLMIMFPMVTSINEFYVAKKIVKDIEKELDEQEIAYDHNIKVGIMIEVPSVALIADQIIDEIDFASVGTNDLCQYLCAADRMNHAVKDYYQDYHPAVFRVLRDLASVFEASGKCLSICGELAGDPLAIPLLAGIGIRTLSMNETSIARAKRVICNMRMEEAKALAEEALDRKSNWEIEKLLREFQEKNRE